MITPTTKVAKTIRMIFIKSVGVYLLKMKLGTKAEMRIDNHNNPCITYHAT